MPEGLLTLHDLSSALHDPSTLMERIHDLLATAQRTAAELAAKERILAEQTAALAALRGSEDEYRAIFELAGVGKAQADLRTGRLLRVNRKFCQMLGYTVEELTGLTFVEITHRDDAASASALRERMLRGEVQEITLEKRYVHRDGRVVWAILNATVLKDASGRPTRSVSTIQDITDRKLAERLEQDRRAVLELVAKDMPLAVVLEQLAESIERQMPDCHAGVVSLQDGQVCLHGPNLPPRWSAAMRLNLLRLAARVSQAAWTAPNQCGVTLMRRDEPWIDLRAHAAEYGIESCWAMPIQSNDQTPIGLLMVFCRQPRGPLAPELQTLDMASRLATICIEHHHTTRQLAHLVRHDPLTGLSNRIMFEDRLHQALALARRSSLAVALMVLDLDRFKSINDTFGHHAGDHILQQFAQRLRSRLREADTMARLGGDEFAIVLPELESSEQASIVARKLVDALVEPFDVFGRMMQVTCSIGVAMFPRDGDDPATLQRSADAALYRVKENGRNGFAL